MVLVEILWRKHTRGQWEISNPKEGRDFGQGPPVIESGIHQEFPDNSGHGIWHLLIIEKITTQFPGAGEDIFFRIYKVYAF